MAVVAPVAPPARRLGDVPTLAAVGAPYGLRVEAVGLVEGKALAKEDQRMSSSSTASGVRHCCCNAMPRSSSWH